MVNRLAGTLIGVSNRRLEDKYAKRALVFVALVVTVKLIELQRRPPEPVELPKSILRLLQDPMEEGKVITTFGLVGLFGAEICIALPLTYDHDSHTPALTVAGQAARNIFACSRSTEPTVKSLFELLLLRVIVRAFP